MADGKGGESESGARRLFARRLFSEIAQDGAEKKEEVAEWSVQAAAAKNRPNIRS